MISKLAKFLAPPKFESEEDQQTADILNSILLAVLLGCGIAIILVPIFDPDRIFRLIYVFIMFPIVWITRWVMMRMHPRIASVIFLTTGWFVNMAVNITGGGLRSATFTGGHMVLVAMAGLLLGWQGVAAFSVLGTLSGVFFLFNERAHILEVSPVITSGLSLLVGNAIYFFITALLFGIAVQRIKEAHALAHKSGKALQISEDMYRRAIMAAGAVPYYRDHRINQYTFMGEGILQMTGYTASEMTPDVWETIQQEGFPRGALARMTYEQADRITEEDSSILWECDYRIRTRDGQTRWVADTSVKGLNEFNERVGVIGILQDITDRKNALLERERLIKDLEARNAELERFTYTVSHDLRAPLVTVQGYLGYIETDSIKGNYERVQKDIQRIKEATSRMEVLLKDLLELSRIGRVMNPPENVSLTTITQEALNNVAGQIEKHKAVVQIDTDLPTVYTDRARLVEVMQNLIENACKYMGTQSEPRIVIGQSMVAGERVFHVRDNGIGIEPQHHERVFGLFDKLNPESEGTGIGLALTKRIIELHGGRIWVESEGTGKGSTFCFTISTRKQETQ